MEGQGLQAHRGAVEISAEGSAGRCASFLLVGVEGCEAEPKTPELLRGYSLCEGYFMYTILW